MRRAVVVALAVVGVLLLGATYSFYSKYKQSELDFAQATAKSDSMRTRYDQAVNEIVMIQDSLNAIVLGESGSLPAQHEVELQPPQTLHDTVLSRISMLKSSIERTKERIEDLDARLKKSGVQVAGLERLIGGLRKTVNEKEERIAQLTTQVDTLETRVVGLSEEVVVQQHALERTREELATIYYAMGTKRELKENGVVEESGGVLGLGKTLKLTGAFDEDWFHTLDTDKGNVIRIPAPKARVVSAQPASSYVLEPAGESAVELRILDPDAFRKIRHVVIVTG